MLSKRTIKNEHTIIIATGLSGHDLKKWIFGTVKVREYEIRYSVKELRPDPDYPDQKETHTIMETSDLDEAIYAFNCL